MSALIREGYRALELFDRIPANHTGVMVTSHDFNPHLRRGEVAVVDTSDKTLQFGELFVITLSESTPRMTLAIVQLLREELNDDGGTGLWYAFHFRGNGGLLFEGRRLRYVDGPLQSIYWPEKCVGRVVGYMAPRWEGRQ